MVGELVESSPSDESVGGLVVGDFEGRLVGEFDGELVVEEFVVGDPVGDFVVVYPS